MSEADRFFKDGAKVNYLSDVVLWQKVGRDHYGMGCCQPNIAAAFYIIRQSGRRTKDSKPQNVDESSAAGRTSAFVVTPKYNTTARKSDTYRF